MGEQLFKNQRDLAKAGADFIGDQGANKFLVLQGLPGQGKSTIALQIARNLNAKRYLEGSAPGLADREGDIVAEPTIVGVEIGRFFEPSEVQSGIRKIRGKALAIIVLARHRTEEVREVMAQLGDSEVSYFSAPLLTAEEIRDMVQDAQCPEMMIPMIEKYSLGIPLLVEYMMRRGPALDEEVCKLILSEYLLRYGPSTKNFLGGSTDIDDAFETLNDFIEKAIGKSLPPEIKERHLIVQAVSPIYGYQAGVYPDSLPLHPHTIQRYHEWLNRYREDFDTEITLFVPDITLDECNGMAGELGIDLWNSKFESGGRMDTLVGDHRKTHMLCCDSQGGRVHGASRPVCAAQSLHVYMRNNGIEISPKMGEHSSTPVHFDVLNSDKRPFFIESADHKVGPQVRIGIALESYLQRRGMRYQLNLGGTKTNHYEEYDPVTKSYRSLQWNTAIYPEDLPGEFPGQFGE